MKYEYKLLTPAEIVSPLSLIVPNGGPDAERARNEEGLNYLGSQGWRPIHILSSFIMFERPIEATEPESITKP